MSLVIDTPRSAIDLHSDESLLDPYPAYRELRDLGSAVYLDCVDAWFIGRYQDVRSALNDWRTFSSDKGIGLNPIINAAWDEALISQDPPVHTDRRKIMVEALGPIALKPVQETIDARAAHLADKLLDMGYFDGVVDFARDLPVNVVMDLIGWPQDVRPHLLKFADGSWNAAGPDNARMREGLVQLQDMMGFITEIYDGNRVEPGGFAAQLIDASHQGLITRDTAIGMLAGYVVAAFETTISAMAAGIYLFATNSSEWTKFRERPDLAVRAANEIVRLEAPLQNFSRWTTTDAELSDGTIVPAHSRVMISYASANRDERQYRQPDAFVIDRKEMQQLGFGHGPHGCAGQGLARMELTAVFRALADRIKRFELTGQPTRTLNNVSRSFRSLPARAVAA